MSEVNGIVRLYACGGAGINLTKEWAGDVQVEPGVANVKPCYVDTSRVNLIPGIDESNSYILPDLDGSGKVRRENNEAIFSEVPRILLDHAPTEFNVVIFSASGGTGSVAGPLIAAELLKRDQNVVVVVVGSDESAITAQNTFNTLKSLDHIANAQEKPVVMYYIHNERELKRSEIDKRVRHVLVSLNYLASRQNKELDTKDIHHWLNYNKSTDLDPSLALLKVHTDVETCEKESDDAFSLASVLKNEDEAHPDLNPAYACAGYYREGVRNPHNLFFGIETKGLTQILSRLQKLAATNNEHKTARQQGPSFKSDKDNISKSGLVL